MSDFMFAVCYPLWIGCGLTMLWSLFNIMTIGSNYGRLATWWLDRGTVGAMVLTWAICLPWSIINGVLRW